MYGTENLSPLQEFFRRKWVRLVLVVDVLLILVLIGVAIFQNTKTAMVDILVVPSIAKVNIGGGKYGSGTYRIHPGDYEAEVSAEGFITKKVPIEARSDEISKAYVYLVPEEGNLNYYAKHDDDWWNMKLMSDEEAQRVYKVLSIKEELPMEYTERVINNEGEVDLAKDITISANNNEACEAYFCLKVATILDKNEDTVRTVLAKKGFSLDDYGVEWKVYNGEGVDYSVSEEVDE